MKSSFLSFRIIRSFKGFSTTDFLSVTGAFLAVLGISVPIVSNKVTDQRLNSAAYQSKAIASSISLDKLEKPDGLGSGGRVPASADDQLADKQKDPWGRLYNVKPIKNAYGQTTRVLVWSNGPNGQNDTRDPEIEALRQVDGARPSFGGDDVGFVRVIR